MPPCPESDRRLRRVCGACCEGASAAEATPCREAALGPIRDCATIDLTTRAGDIRAISRGDLEDALGVIRSSVSTASLEGYERWNKEFGATLP